MSTSVRGPSISRAICSTAFLMVSRAMMPTSRLRAGLPLAIEGFSALSHVDGSPDELLYTGFRHNFGLAEPDAPLADVEARQERAVGIDLTGVAHVQRHVMLLCVEGEHDVPLVPVAEHLVVDPFGQVGTVLENEIPERQQLLPPPVVLQGLQVLLRALHIVLHARILPLETPFGPRHYIRTLRCMWVGFLRIQPAGTRRLLTGDRGRERQRMLAPWPPRARRTSESAPVAATAAAQRHWSGNQATPRHAVAP